MCPMRTLRNILRIQESAWDTLLQSSSSVSHADFTEHSKNSRVMHSLQKHSQACLITVDLRHNANKYPKGWLIDGLERMNLPQKIRKGNASSCLGQVHSSGHVPHGPLGSSVPPATGSMSSSASSVKSPRPCCVKKPGKCFCNTLTSRGYVGAARPRPPRTTSPVDLRHPANRCRKTQKSANGSMSSSGSLSRACSVKSPRPCCVEKPGKCFCNTLTSRGFVGAARPRSPRTTSPVDLRHPANRCRQGLALLSKSMSGNPGAL